LGIAGPRSIEDRCGTAAGGCLSIDRNICLLKSKEGVGKRSGTNVQTNSGNVNSNNMGYYHNQKGCNKNVSIDSRRTNMNTNSNTNASINTNINTNTNTCINNYINSNTLTDNNNNNISNKNIGSTQHK
jgi:hypothetical protein